jgi:hypothetical protein
VAGSPSAVRAGALSVIMQLSLRPVAALGSLEVLNEDTMGDSVTIIAGIPIPSTSPVFLVVVGIHVLFGLVCAVTGIVAMLSAKGRGQHSNFGTIYYRCLSGVFVTAVGLSVVRWAEDYHLSFSRPCHLKHHAFGRRALRQRWRNWPSLHLTGMGASYILLLTAFYVDNGKNLPLWRELPQLAFWLLPGAIGVPIILYALRRHRVVLRSR